MSSSKNLEFEKTSFLSKSNSAFIEQMYLKFINKDKDLPESWQHYFEGIGEDLSMIAKEINGPSWGIKQKIDIDEIEKRIEEDEKKLSNGSNDAKVNSKDLIKSNLNSIRALIELRLLLIKSFELTFASLLPLESFFSSSSILFSISSISIFCFIPHDGPLISLAIILKSSPIPSK